MGVPFTDVQRVEEVVQDIKPDYILVSYDQERMKKITDLRNRQPGSFHSNLWKPDLRAHFDVMLYSLMCGHHHLDPALEYAKENDVPIFAVDRSEFLTTFRASQSTVGRLPKMLNMGKTVKMLTPFLTGTSKISDLTQEFLEDARESLDSEEVDFERQQLMKLPAYGEERGEILAHRIFYFEAEPNAKVLAICQRALFEHTISEWGKTTDEDMHALHIGPDEKRKKRARVLMGAAGTMLYSLPFYIASAYFDPAMIGIMWASIPTYMAVATPLKMRQARERCAMFYNKVRELDEANGLAERWRGAETSETIGPEINYPKHYKGQDIQQRFSPKNFGDPEMPPKPNPIVRDEEKSESEKKEA